MAFEALSDRLQGIFKKIRGQSELTEKNMEEVTQEIYVALLEADVNVKVAREFVAKLKTKILGMKVLPTLTPSQMVVKLVNEELKNLLGGEATGIDFSKKPTIIMMVGLQGSGKTTTASKLANLVIKKNNRKPLLVACDIYRPGAIEQLVQLGKKIDVEVYQEGDKVNPVDIAKNAIEFAKYNNYDTIIVDTAGRLHIDEQLMEELKNIQGEIHPTETILVVDSMSGQDAVNVADSFYKQIKITGAIMTKMDGDARGGAALSIRHMTGVPLKYIAVGEKVDDLEIFYPDRMAERILGMGDILALIEKAQENLDEKKLKKTMNRMMSGQFDLEDFLVQMEQMNKMGPLGAIMKLIPGMPKLSDEQKDQAEKKLKVTRTIIYSMTIEERKNPDILRASRKERIAKGSGTTVVDVNRLLKQFDQMKVQMRQMSQMMKSGRFPRFK